MPPILNRFSSIAEHPRYSFVRADICDAAKMSSLIEYYRPDVIIHFAAESHVDRSIDGPSTFIETNIVGTFSPAGSARLLADATISAPGPVSFPSYFD